MSGVPDRSCQRSLLSASTSEVDSGTTEDEDFRKLSSCDLHLTALRVGLDRRPWDGRAGKGEMKLDEELL